MKNQHPNIEILKIFDPTNLAAMAEVLAEDFVWHFINPELPDVQGDYLGLEGLTDFFKRMSGNTDGTFKVTPISIMPVGEEFVVVHVKDKMILKGQQLEIDAVVVWRIVNGEIKEAWDIPAVNTAKIIAS